MALAEDLPLWTEVVTPPGRSYKLQPFLPGIEQKQTKGTKGSEFFVSFVSFCEISNTADIVADSDKSWHRSTDSPVTQVLATDIDKTVLEVWTMANVLAGTFEFTGGTGPKTITNAQLVAVLGSETDFRLRAYFVRSGYRSLNNDEVTVRKV